MEMTHPITVVYSFDRNYARYAAVSAYSLALHARTELQVVWIVPEADEASVIPTAAYLAQKTGLDLRLISVPMHDLGEWKVSDHFTQATYLRLLVADLVQEPRVIFLDADTLVVNDLSALWETQLGENVIAGVPDQAGGETSKVVRTEGDPYINAGVLLMNLEALRNDRMQEKARAIYRHHCADLTWFDQCVLNKYAEGRKLVLDKGWNRQIAALEITEAEFDDLLKEPGLAVLHFVTNNKPWHPWCNRRVIDLWWRYANEMGIEGLEPQEIITIGQRWALARMLDRNGRFEEASAEKEKVIKDLVEFTDRHDKLLLRRRQDNARIP
jgi:lipopolysaccharide biosynthesis glycosyltransferase